MAAFDFKLVIMNVLESDKIEADEEGFNSQATGLLPGVGVNAGCVLALAFFTKSLNMDALLLTEELRPTFFRARLLPLLLKSQAKWGEDNPSANFYSFWALNVLLTMRCQIPGKIGLQQWAASKESIEEHSRLIPTSIASFILSGARQLMLKSGSSRGFTAFEMCCRGLFNLLSLKLMDSSEAATASGKPYLATSIPGGPRITLTKGEALEFVEFLAAPLRGTISMDEMREGGIVEHFVTICCYLSNHDTIATGAFLKHMAGYGFISGLLSLMKLYKPTCPISIAAPASAAIQAIRKGSKEFDDAVKQ